MPILLQINIARDDKKYGFSKESVKGVLEECSSLPNVEIKGIMIIAPLTVDEVALQRCFREAYQLYKSLQIFAPNMDILSMGMSSDYELAIAEGATMVRVGSLLYADKNQL